jgi:hypothetical protein
MKDLENYFDEENTNNMIDSIQDNNELLLCVNVNDFDLTSCYPTAQVAYNVANNTLLCSVYELVDHEYSSIEDVFSCLNAKKENVNYIAEKHLNLPNYKEIEDIFKNEFHNT